MYKSNKQTSIYTKCLTTNQKLDSSNLPSVPLCCNVTKQVEQINPPSPVLENSATTTLVHPNCVDPSLHLAPIFLLVLVNQHVSAHRHDILVLQKLEYGSKYPTDILPYLHLKSRFYSCFLDLSIRVFCRY